MSVYLDHNATTPLLPEVAETMARSFTEEFANPGSPHSAGRRARRRLEEARESIAALLGADPDEVIFTSGGTEAINLAIHGLLAARRPSEHALPELLVQMAGEHPAAAGAGRAAAQTHRLDRVELPLDNAGRLDASRLDEVDWSRAALATAILAHNETGVVQDLGPLAERCARAAVPWHVDAVQAVGKIAVDFRALGADALSLAAHKFNGPRGVGALLLKRGTTILSRLQGGHQERGLRPGTEPVPLIAGMACALEAAHRERDERSARLRALRDELERGLAQRCAPVVVHGAAAVRLPNTLHVSFPGLDGAALLVACDLAGICCSLGSACASGSQQPSPVLVAMGENAEVIRGSLRFSLGATTTRAEVEETIGTVAEIVARQRAAARRAAP